MISSIGTSSVLPVTSFLPILSFRGRNGYSLGKSTREEGEKKGTGTIFHDMMLQQDSYRLLACYYSIFMTQLVEGNK